MIAGAVVVAQATAKETQVPTTTPLRQDPSLKRSTVDTTTVNGTASRVQTPFRQALLPSKVVLLQVCCVNCQTVSGKVVVVATVRAGAAESDHHLLNAAKCTRRVVVVGTAAAAATLVTMTLALTLALTTAVG